MADAARAEATHPHPGLPDEIFIWEILVRLHPKSLLRCRAVCRDWRSATSARDFLLAHHARQPTLPLLYGHDYKRAFGIDGESLDIIPFDHRAAAADQLRPIARLAHPLLGLEQASCDGLLVLSVSNRNYAIYNPATRQSALLPMLSDVQLFGMYRHRPTDEYRILIYDDWRVIDGHAACYIFALGSVQPPRSIGWRPEAHDVNFCGVAAVLFRGNLHWHLPKRDTGSSMIMVFDTITESFRQMRAPVSPDLPNLYAIDDMVGMCAPLVPDRAYLFEMDGFLGMSSFNDIATVIDIWMMQDYESEVWAFKSRVKLPVAEIRVQYENFEDGWDVIVVPGDGELLVLVQFGKWLLQVDMDSKLVASFRREFLSLTQRRLKQTLVSHTFFPTLKGYAVNAWPFI